MTSPTVQQGSIDFASLSEAEQREVAERLLKIQESGWKPFWCPDPACTGDPHVLLDEHGDEVMVGPTDVDGPNGEPLHPETVWSHFGQNEDGELEEEEEEFYLAAAPEDPLDRPYGRLVIDPQWAHNHARVDQRLPGWQDPWTLFIMSGRGSGKTTTGTEFVTLCARKGLDGAILGRRGTELVNTHVATIIARAHPEFMPVHYASKDILVWPNGATTYLFSAEKPENIRSVNLSYAWVDEAAFMDEIETAWMNLKLATRIEKPNNPIHFLITSTPTATKWVMDMEDDPEVEVRRVSTYANRANLSASFLSDMEKNFEGTRMGRQELHGEVLRDVEGALWNDGMFQHLRLDAVDFVTFLDGLDDRVLGVDPAGSKGPRSDATGIIGVGAHHYDDDQNPLAGGSNFHVLLDATIKGSPTEWARQTFKAARLIRANRIVVEKNFGGEMVKQVLRDFATKHPSEAEHWDGSGENMADMVEVVHAVQGKETRAEGTVGKYEQARVTHVTSPVTWGDLSALEKEQVGWVPKSRGGKHPSPNRIDALVWAVRALETKVKHVANTATSKDIMKKFRKRGGPSAA